MLQQILQGFDLTRVFRLPSGLFTSQEDSLTDWLILIKLFVVDKLICPLHTFHIANIDCYIVKTCTYKLSHWSAWIIFIIDLTPYCLLVNSGTLTLIHHLWKLPLPDPPDWLCSKCLIAVRGRPERLTDLYSFSFFFLARPSVLSRTKISAPTKPDSSSVQTKTVKKWGFALIYHPNLYFTNVFSISQKQKGSSFCQIQISVSARASPY